MPAQRASITGLSPACHRLVTGGRWPDLAIERAFIVTPGDNDWTDCHRVVAGADVPTERLPRFRQVYYPVPGRTTGTRPFKVVTQASTPGFETSIENVRWSFAGVTMATLPTESPKWVHARRASLAWIEATFDAAIAADSAGLMISIQAEPLWKAPVSALKQKAGVASRAWFLMQEWKIDSTLLQHPTA